MKGSGTIVPSSEDVRITGVTREAGVGIFSVQTQAQSGGTLCLGVSGFGYGWLESEPEESAVPMDCRRRWPWLPWVCAGELAGAATGGWFIYWKFCETDALGAFVSTGTSDKLPLDCAKTDEPYARTVRPVARRRTRFIG